MKVKVDPDQNLGDKSSKNKKNVNRKKDKAVKNSNNPQNCKLSKELKDVSVSLKHKKCSGVDNWKLFLENQGMSLKISNKRTNNNFKFSCGKVSNGISNKITKVVGMDCEMVGIGENGMENMLARVSLVNNFGDCIYDKYVKPREKVTDYRTPVSGIRPEDIENGEEFVVVQKEVAEILKSRILVGHALKNDLDVLFLSHPKSSIRDTSIFFCKKRRTPSLKNLAAEYLQVKIQEGEHSSVQDAQAAMQLYNMYRKQWEAGKGNKYRRKIDSSESQNKPIISGQPLEVI